MALRKSWVLYLGTAIPLTVRCLTIIGTNPIWRGPNIQGYERAVYAGAHTVAVWCWVFAFVGAAIRFLSGPGPATRYLADASCWIYHDAHGASHLRTLHLGGRDSERARPASCDGPGTALAEHLGTFFFERLRSIVICSYFTNSSRSGGALFTESNPHQPIFRPVGTTIPI